MKVVLINISFMYRYIKYLCECDHLLLYISMSSIINYRCVWVRVNKWMNECKNEEVSEWRSEWVSELV